SVDEGLGLGVKTLEWLRPFPEELPHTLVTVVGTAYRAVVAFPDDCRVVEPKQGLHVRGLPSATHDLDVLLRHRLLREAGDFEGVVVRVVGAELHDQAAP